MNGPEQTQWGIVFRIALILCLVPLAACGVAEANAGVRVVEPFDTVAAPPTTVVESDPVSEFGSQRSASERFQESLPQIDIVAGPDHPPRPLTVAVVGDSLTLSAQDEITAALDQAGLRVIVVDGVESRRMTRGSTDVPPGSESVEQILERADPDVWVLALGTNDVGGQSGDDAFRAEMGDLLDLLPPDAPVIWVDLWIRDRDADIVVANRSIRAVLGGRQGVAAVVDWYTEAAAPGMIVSDGVHLTDQGQLRFADAMVHAIETAFAI